LLSVVSGSQNSAVGYESLLTINSGAGNTGFGHQVLRSTGVGDANTAMGRGAMLSNLSGDNNVALGANALETNTVGNANVCLGYFAGYNVAGSGNVLIGPADSGNPVNDATYSPLNPSGDRQLVIGSGTEFWVRGDSNFDVTISNDLTVNTDLTVKGDLVVNGVTTTIKSNTLEVSDKNIELAKVVSTQFTCTTADGSANISSISPTLGLIPGMVVTSNTAGVSVPNNTTIVSLSSNTAVLSNNVSGTGTPTFSAIGPSDTAADGGGIILDGTTDHTFTWSNANNSWQSSENMDLVNGKTYNIIDGSGNARQLLSLTQIGPTAGTGVVSGLGSGVTSSVLTSVGSLGTLDVTGDISCGSSIGINGSGGSAYPLHVYSGQKYLVGLKNTAANSGTGYPWLVNDSVGGQNSLLIHYNGIGDRFIFSENGRLGIAPTGSFTAECNLHLKAGNDRACVRLENTYDTPDNVWELQPGISGVSNTGFCIRDITDSANRLVIDGSGDISIGSDSNDGNNRLYVVDSFTDAFVNPSDSILRIENADTSGTTGQASISFTSKTTTSNADSAIVSQAEDASGNARLEFWTDTNNGMSEKMSIDSTGAVNKPLNPCLKTAANNNYGSVGSLTTNTANTGILQTSASIDKGTTGWTTTGANAYTFVCPVDGIYVVHANISYGNGISGRQIWVMSYTLGGGNLPLDAYVEIIDHTAVSYGNYSYYDTYEFTAGTRVGMGKNGGSGTLTGQSLQWGIHLLQ